MEQRGDRLVLGPHGAGQAQVEVGVEPGGGQPRPAGGGLERQPLVVGDGGYGRAGHRIDPSQPGDGRELDDAGGIGLAAVRDLRRLAHLPDAHASGLQDGGRLLRPLLEDDEHVGHQLHGPLGGRAINAAGVDIGEMELRSPEGAGGEHPAAPEGDRRLAWHHRGVVVGHAQQPAVHHPAGRGPVGDAVQPAGHADERSVRSRPPGQVDRPVRALLQEAYDFCRVREDVDDQRLGLHHVPGRLGPEPEGHLLQRRPGEAVQHGGQRRSEPGRVGELPEPGQQADLGPPVAQAEGQRPLLQPEEGGGQVAVVDGDADEGGQPGEAGRLGEEAERLDHPLGAPVELAVGVAGAGPCARP
ncbi:MAG: hypothetical protein AVDCRST_MAG10-2770 [uncultured Acidimicrobiales bacterium]|uniref:Uncharacterized protein n=1 Tax=uncultured Acidimicrobiales bacterium TaxID=310071 RepID=A0A6J4IT93_9ACTN|nr:MAG: hypothetical protein AVDCRST_MAG10-2770 [uncultured Acidimicrobiales bacterium]